MLFWSKPKVLTPADIIDQCIDDLDVVSERLESAREWLGELVEENADQIGYLRAVNRDYLGQIGSANRLRDALATVIAPSTTYVPEPEDGGEG